MVAADSTRHIEAGKRYLIGLLRQMAEHVSDADIQVRWHDWSLVKDGQPTVTVVVSPSASDAVRSCAAAISRCVSANTGIILTLVETDEPSAIQEPLILVGEAKDPLVSGLVEAVDLQLDAQYPGKDNYRIKQLADRRVLAILGTDAAGVARGVRNWLAFVEPEGHWLLQR